MGLLDELIENEEDICPMTGIVADGRAELDDCPNHGSSDCPLTIGSDERCDVDLEWLAGILVYRR